MHSQLKLSSLRPLWRYSAKGFTLIELLVVMSIVAILLAIMLPVLGGVRDSSRQTICLSNQRGLMAAWTVAMVENKGKIPFITQSPGKVDHRNETWTGLLGEQFGVVDKDIDPDNLVLHPNDPPDPSLPRLCPEIETRFDRPSYMSLYFGYNINSRWAGCGPTHPDVIYSSRYSQGQQWDNIPRPSEYPWFSDPLVLSYPPAFIALSRFGEMQGTEAKRENFGLSFYHQGDTSNAVFADGHAESYKVNVLEEKGPCGTPKWMLAVKP